MSELPSTDCKLIQYDEFAQPRIIKLYNVLLDSGTSDILIPESCLADSYFSTHKLPTEHSMSNALNQDSGCCIDRAFLCNILFPKFSITLVNIKVFIVKGPLAFSCILGMSPYLSLSVIFGMNVKLFLSNKLSQTAIIVNNNVIVINPTC